MLFVVADRTVMPCDPVTSPLSAPVNDAADPVVLWFRVGMSDGTIDLKAGCALAPLIGPEKNVAGACVLRVSVKEPDDVIGLPVMLNIGDVEPSVKPTEVTVPDVGALDDILMPPAMFVTVVFAPATMFRSPVKELRLVTPELVHWFGLNASALCDRKNIMKNILIINIRPCVGRSLFQLVRAQVL